MPLLDGADNPDSVEQVTVRFDDHPSGALDAHTYPHYLAGAAAVDAATDPSVVERVAGLRDRGFLLPGGSPPPTVDTRVFQVVRGD